ncbi:MAG: T9SS type A sorting domain-containing protein [Nonlabens sp.]|uniref:LamG-like jellyroll fold domain-containing protein n=1 Tax=Nonlabens sp. TaxID=1888209 RepID=UPI0035A63349
MKKSTLSTAKRSRIFIVITLITGTLNAQTNNLTVNFKGHQRHYQNNFKTVNLSNLSKNNYAKVTPYSNYVNMGNEFTVSSNNDTHKTTDATDFNSTAKISIPSETFTIQNTGSSHLDSTGISIPITKNNTRDLKDTSQYLKSIKSSGPETLPDSLTKATYELSNASNEYTSNNTSKTRYKFNDKTASASPITTLYYENFDNGPAGWYSTNTGAVGFQFSLGKVANEKGEGDYWYTDSWNNFPNNASATITSPIINTLGYTDLKFYLDFRTNTNDVDDGMRVQYTTDGGSFWTTLGSITSGNNWYNDSDINGFSSWSGDSSTLDSSLSRFEEASHILPVSVSNHSNIRFRISFASNGASTDDGVLFDNIIITGRKTVPDVAADGPANVNDNLTLWLKSQNIPSTNGSVLPLWEDQALDNDAFEIAANAPVYANNVSNNINFNPSVVFDRSQQQHIRGKGGYNSNDYWIVVRSTLDMTGAIASETMLIGAKCAAISPSKDPSGLGWGPISARYDNEVIAHSIGTVSETDLADDSYGRSFSHATRTFDDVHILNVKNNPNNNQTEIYLNGRKIDNLTGVNEVSRDTLIFCSFTNKPYYLGTGRQQLNGFPLETHLNGEITEVFSYRDRRSDAVQQRIYSYLAIKNGVSLHNPTSTLDDHRADWDYLDSDDQIIWSYSSNTLFNFDVTAIGKDNKSDLIQKQSKSENSTSVVAIGLNRVEDLGTQNAEHFDNDKDFLFWGHNGEDLNAYRNVINHDIGIANAVRTNITRVNRVWKIEENTTTDISTTEVRVASIDFSGLPALTTNREYVLMIADDENFNTNLETRIFYNDGDWERASYNFDGIKYFTLAISEVEFDDRSVYFDGIDDRIVIDEPQEFGSRFSASTWILSQGSNSTNTERTIVAKRSNGSGFQLSLRTDNRITLRWNSNTLEEMISNTTLDNGVWVQITVTYDNHIAKIYIDGVMDSQATLSAAIPDENMVGIGARIDQDEIAYDHFHGEIDEIRIWNIALSQDQIRFIMNQEIEKNSNLVSGSIIPNTITKNDIAGLNWNTLKAYYSMNSFIGTSLNDESGNKGYGRMANENYFELKTQTAPLPYISSGTGNWENPSSWNNGIFLFTPGSTRVINGSVEKINWNIVKTSNEITIANSNITLLGLFVESDQLNVDNDHGLTITHILDLQGSIDLKGASQLVQTTNSDLITTTTGFIERDQQGTGNIYNYNYWSSPVSITINNNINNGYTLADVMKDGTLVDPPRDLNWTNRNISNGSIGDATNAATISGKWLYKFGNLASGTYSNWQYSGPYGAMNAGEGYTMKGTGSITDQNYIFKGKPNNGDIDLPISIGNDYLIGNPYASSLDANEFLADNPNLNGTLYFWEHCSGNSHLISDYQGGYAMYNFSGGVVNATLGTSSPDINQGGIATKRPERFVPVAQGFFVTGISNGAIRFRNDQRQFVIGALGSSLFVYPPDSDTANTAYSNYNSFSDTRPKIRLGFDCASEIHRQLLLTIDPNASMNYDHAFDGIQVDQQNEDMAFILGTDYLTIQGIDALNMNYELPLMIKLSSIGSITIKLDEVQNVDPTQQIFLKDAVLATYTNLRSGDYTSPSLAVGTNTTRYSIVFEDPTALSNENVGHLASDLLIYTPSDRRVLNIVKGHNVSVEKVTLNNMLGQQIQTWNVGYQIGDISLSTTNIARGTYVVILTTNYGIQTRKVIIK